MRGCEQQLDGRHRRAVRGFCGPLSRPEPAPRDGGRSGRLLCPQPGHCRDFGPAAGFHRRRRAYQSGIPARLCRLFRCASRRRRGRRAHYRRVCDGTSRVALEIYRDADRQSDGFRRRRAAVSCRPGAGRRQHGVPAFGGPALRGLRPFAGACRTDVDRG